MARVMVAVDPGIDYVAAAVFEWGEMPSTAVETVGGFQRIESVRTKPKTPLPDRLLAIAEFSENVVRSSGADWLAVEMPPTWHAKLQKGRIPPANLLKSVAKLNMAIGATWAGGGRVEHVELVEVEAPSQSKVERHASLERLMKVNGWKPLTNEDQRDALWTGVLAVGMVEW